MENLLFLSATVCIIIIVCNYFIISSFIKKYNNEIEYQKSVNDSLWCQVEDYIQKIEKSEINTAHLNSIIEENKFFYTGELEYLQRSVKERNEKIKFLKKRIENISFDNSKRSVIGGKYKVGDKLYHKYNNRIKSGTVSYINFIDFGHEYDVSYGFYFRGIRYEISEDSCFLDKENALF